MASIIGWRGQEIAGARSRRGGEFWAHDWRDMVLDPAGAIATKAAESAGRASGWFAAKDIMDLRSRDGRCCFVQSLRSEDSVTWAAFGSRVTDTAISSVLERAFGDADRPTPWTRTFWRRYQHPDTRRARGPEPDVVLDAPGWRYVVEAKWLADLDDKQGADGRTGQVAMRAGIAREIEDPRKRGVLVVAPGPNRYMFSRSSAFARYFEVDGDSYRARPLAESLEARAVTWEQVTDAIERDLGDVEVVRYLRWRLEQVPIVT